MIITRIKSQSDNQNSQLSLEKFEDNTKSLCSMCPISSNCESYVCKKEKFNCNVIKSIALQIRDNHYEQSYKTREIAMLYKDDRIAKSIDVSSVCYISYKYCGDKVKVTSILDREEHQYPKGA